MPGKLYKILIPLGLMTIGLFISLYWLSSHEAKQLKVSFLDVGQGDSVLIQTPYGQNILIDGGPDDSVTYGLSKNLPWWDRTIDLMILTHPHDDHVSGLLDVIKRYNVKKIAYTGVAHGSPNYLAWIKLVRNKKIPIVIIDQPRKIVLGDECYLDVLYPMDSLLNNEVDNINNSSIVAKLVYKNIKFLLTGDIEKAVEVKLLANNTDISAHILKLAHHGSDTSSAEDFLTKVNPDIAVISVGKNNTFGHPGGRIINRIERIGKRIFRTDLDGEVDFVSDGVRVYKE
ncbi:MBL fold metallo-hydrolase [Candidatus Parcubacteria bacterium]|nr:MBL fold metallo-hydrolase [Patescibacteria group bacterium]MBU4309031.1 MBL fold metallo-hydrolase [Patescibacteria group bacterium]MBU4432374.1 MBL fold metallo-hydrolase [Patescibacteria group bacterium]MBU4577392.1 MBL fold metallo-hydrolase [Patescibacteria group bacterium]MCG2697080.1 MBL fold metallo-hydrolase [Candidatus Parcubacteria bacterium]